jgi:endonuclease-8
VPEGDTVWRTARRLDQALSGRPLTVSDFRVPDLATVNLVGRTVTETVSRGKHLLTRVADVTIHTHLKMEGSWHVYKATSPWRAPAFQARLVLANEQWQAVGFRLGTVAIVAGAEEHTVVGHLGPDLLGPDWSLDEALRRLTEAPERELGVALLDQRNLAGIGNMYKSELCFVLGVNPWTPTGEVDVLPQLLDKAHRMLALNKERSDQTTTGDTRRGRQFWVYGRIGQPCRRCGTPIRSADQGGDGRATFWCPTCQPRS